MIIPAEVVGVLALAGSYVLIAIGWFALNTTEARANYRRAKRYQSGEFLATAEYRARMARRAPYWLPWIAVMATRTIRAALTDTRALVDGSTELQQAMRELEIKKLEREIARLRTEQEDT